MNKWIYLYDVVSNFLKKLKDTCAAVLWIIFYFFWIFSISALFSYWIMISIFKIDFNFSNINDFNVLKCLAFLITNTFLVFILSTIFNFLYFKLIKNEWVYITVNAFLLIMISSVIFIILGLNSTIETYVINEFQKYIYNSQYNIINMDDTIYIVRSLYNMFIYWVSSTIVTFQISFNIVNNQRKKVNLI